MPSQAVQPVGITKLDDWSRVYAFEFAESFVEFNAPPSSLPTIVSFAVAADDGITAAFDSLVAPGTINVRISGGTVGDSYNVSVSVVLSSGDELSLPALVSVVAPGPGGIPQKTLGKLPGWERHYLFPFGKVFSEFNVSTPPAIVGTPAFTCQPASDGSTLNGTPVPSGTSAIVFVTGGNSGEQYQVRCTVTTSGGDTLSIPGMIVD
jgi:hypothetical protein